MVAFLLSDVLVFIVYSHRNIHLPSFLIKNNTLYIVN